MKATALRSALFLLFALFLLLPNLTALQLAATDPALPPTPSVIITGEPFSIDPAFLRQYWRENRQQQWVAGLLPRSASGRTIYVDVNAAPNGDRSAARPFQTIRAGLDAAVAEDSVLVRPGTYNEIVAMKDRVAVIGTGKSEDVVILSGASPIVFCADGSLLQNLTINSISSGGAGVIDCTNVSPIVNRVVINIREQVVWLWAKRLSVSTIRNRSLSSIVWSKISRKLWT